MKIGLLGGTFDPIHTAHLDLAKKIIHKYALDKIIFIPSGTSYFKKGVTEKCLRYEMVKLAIDSDKNFNLSDIETKRTGNSYACDTVKELKANKPFDTYYWIMGSDSFLELPSWKDYIYLLNSLYFIIYMRPGDSIKATKELASLYQDKYNSKISIIEDTPYFISSSEIRNHIYDQDFNHSYLPETVENFIIKHNLYR